MNIQSVNSYTQLNIVNPAFKERDIVEDHVKTPYEQEMDWLYEETQNQIKLMKYFHKENPARMKKEIKSVVSAAFKKAEAIKAKYLKPKSFFQRLLKR